MADNTGTAHDRRRWLESLATIGAFYILKGRQPRWKEWFGGIDVGEWARKHRRLAKPENDGAYRSLNNWKRMWLNDLEGWSWQENSSRGMWDRNADTLEEYIKAWGRCPQPGDLDENSARLGTWLAQQTTPSRFLRLVESRQKRLAKMIGWNPGEQD